MELTYEGKKYDTTTFSQEAQNQIGSAFTVLSAIKMEQDELPKKFDIENAKINALAAAINQQLAIIAQEEIAKLKETGEDLSHIADAPVKGK